MVKVKTLLSITIVYVWLLVNNEVTILFLLFSELKQAYAALESVEGV